MVQPNYRASMFLSSPREFYDGINDTDHFHGGFSNTYHNNIDYEESRRLMAASLLAGAGATADYLVQPPRVAQQPFVFRDDPVNSAMDRPSTDIYRVARGLGMKLDDEWQGDLSLKQDKHNPIYDYAPRNE